jgi:hypothetical protein
VFLRVSLHWAPQGSLHDTRLVRGLAAERARAPPSIVVR